MSDNDDTDVRLLGLIIELTGKAYCKDKGCANDTDMGQFSIMQNYDGTMRHYTTVVQTWDDSASCNDQTQRQGITQQSIVEAWDGTRRSNLPWTGQSQQSFDED